MGIIIAPIFIGIIVICVFAVKKIMQLILDDLIDWKIWLGGIMLSFLLYKGVEISYSYEENVWGLSPFFRIPIAMIYLPSLVGFSLIHSKNTMVKSIAGIIIVSIVFSGIAMFLFHSSVFGILDNLQIKQHF